MSTAPPPLKCDIEKKTETNWMKIGTKTILDHRMCLHRVSETFRKLQKFSEGSTRKQNRQRSHSLTSAGVCAFSKNAHFMQCSRCQILHQNEMSLFMHITINFLMTVIIWLSCSPQLLTSFAMPILKLVIIIISLFKSVCSCLLKSITCFKVIMDSVCMAVSLSVHSVVSLLAQL